ncbi:Ctr copper transporter family-domain-containing protein [Melanogaster broomeanus]|nr:Ctr copper transporter family-domain-containing protein [Melanogaster broomeanus]
MPSDRRTVHHNNTQPTTTMIWHALAISLCFITPGFADNGMDMSKDGPMDVAVGNMLPYLHFTSGDNLWFPGWVPKSAGAMVGACIGIFLLALLERWVAASRALIELHWSTRASILVADKSNAAPVPALPGVGNFRRLTPPFIPSHDITRGVMFAGQALLNYLFMLTVMTFQLGFILSLIVGLGVGETLFGRFSPSAHVH